MPFTSLSQDEPISSHFYLNRSAGILPAALAAMIAALPLGMSTTLRAPEYPCATSWQESGKAPGIRTLTSLPHLLADNEEHGGAA